MHSQRNAEGREPSYSSRPSVRRAEEPTDEREPLPTLWEVTDEMWTSLRTDQRKCLGGIIYRMHTG